MSHSHLNTWFQVVVNNIVHVPLEGEVACAWYVHLHFMSGQTSA